MKEPRTVFGRRLREARLACGLTQISLGIAAGIDSETASARMAQYERGTHTPPFEVTERLAKVLRVPAAHFYARDDDLAAIICVVDRLSKRARRRIYRSISSSF